MALPADFNKIFGSTATGGLTPIGDVNYAKGWEFVGSNPPTKNDFSYLQNLSDLKSQWLYSNKLQRTDPFGDIKSDGTVPKALTNLGLGEAAKRNVGTGANQIPDMASFASGDGWMKLPNGKILQYGRGRVSPTLASQTLRVVFNIPFPKKADIALLSHSGDGGSDSGSGRGFIMTTEDIGLTGFYSTFRTTSTSPSATMSYYWWAVGE